MKPTEQVPIFLTLRDAYQYVDRGQDSFNDESKKIPVPSSSIPHTDRTAVLLIFGQSNSANHSTDPFTPEKNVYEFNFFTGNCFKASDPLLGATGRGGSFGSRLGDALVKSGLFSDVVLACISVGGTYMEDWTPSGIHHRRILIAIKRLREIGFDITYLIWHQGEGNVGVLNDPIAYRAHFLEMMNSIRSRGVDAPIFVPLVSVCNSAPDQIIRRAQADLPDPALGIFPGPDTDTLGPEKRHDGCHLSGEGSDDHAKMWLLTLDHFIKHGPQATAPRVTAATIGAATDEQIAAAVLSSGPTRPTRIEYKQFGITKQLIPTAPSAAQPTDGASILGLNFRPSASNSRLQIRIMVHGFATKDNEMVVTVFREGRPDPVSMASRPVKASQRVTIDETFELSPATTENLRFDVRVGVARSAGELYINGDPRGMDKSLPTPFIEIQEMNRQDVENHPDGKACC